jgi:Ca-activated chloride channel homolog
MDWLCHGAQVALLAATLFCSPQYAPSARALSADSTTVVLHVTVTDRAGIPVSNLAREDFRVFEDKVEQKVEAVRLDDTALTVGILVDTSSSMVTLGSYYRQALVQFSSGFGTRNEFFLVEFNDRAHLEVPFTDDFKNLLDRVAQRGFSGTSSTIDAIFAVTSYFQKARNQRKALLVISDAADNSSKRKFAEVESAILGSGIQVYWIFTALDPLEEEWGLRRLFWDLSERTGGHPSQFETPKELLDAARLAGRQMLNCYALEYALTSRQIGGRPRRLSVKARAPRGSPPLRVYTGPRLTVPSK